MRWFRKRKCPNRMQQRARNLLHDGLLYVQRQWVYAMQKLDKKISVQQKKWMLGLFCISGCLCCTLILINSFSVDEYSSSNIPTTPVVKRTLSDQPVGKLSGYDTLAILHFRKIIDSLNLSDSGREALEALELRRPGLLDSFYKMEKSIH